MAKLPKMAVSQLVASETERLDDGYLRKLECDCGLFKSFNVDTAWELGNYARKEVIERFPKTSVVIDITSSNGECLFRTVTANRFAAENDCRVQSERNSVSRNGDSSFLTGKINRDILKLLSPAVAANHHGIKEHGGCVHIRHEATDLIVVTLTISGFPQQDNHVFACHFAWLEEGNCFFCCIAD